MQEKERVERAELEKEKALMEKDKALTEKDKALTEKEKAQMELEQSKREIARNLLKLGMKIEHIVQAIGLSEEEIQESCGECI